MLLLQQSGPANTVIYMIAGYTVIFGVLLIYMISLYIRQRNLKQDIDTLQELEKKDTQEKSAERGAAFKLRQPPSA